MSEKPRILFCHCNYAQVVPPEVKEGVLGKLCESGRAFEAVSDLCEMSARRDSALKRLADGGRPVKVHGYMALGYKIQGNGLLSNMPTAQGVGGFLHIPFVHFPVVPFCCGPHILT